MRNLISVWATMTAISLGGCSSQPPLPERPDKPSAKIPAVPTDVAPASYEASLEPPRLKPVLTPLPARTAATPVVRPYQQWTEQEIAADALGRIGLSAVPALREALQNVEPEVRLQAAEVLGRMGPDAKEAVADLVRLLDDPDDRVRRAAARTLGRIGPDAEEAVPALMKALLTPDS